MTRAVPLAFPEFLIQTGFRRVENSRKLFGVIRLLDDNLAVGERFDARAGIP